MEWVSDWLIDRLVLLLLKNTLINLAEYILISKKWRWVLNDYKNGILSGKVIVELKSQ